MLKETEWLFQRMPEKSGGGYDDDYRVLYGGEGGECEQVV